MGKLRSDSERIRAVRAAKESEDRPTLITCPACSGEGKRMLETPEGRYRFGPCPWCSGNGTTTAEMVAGYRRAERIAQWAKLKGRECKPSA